jgi:hypothetical protein
VGTRVVPIFVPFAIVPLADRAIVTITGDKLDRASKRLAGPNATNCGHVRFGSDARKASLCALTAFRDKKPFRVRYSLWDITFVDATKDVSMVGAPDGHVYELSSYYGFHSPASGEDVTTEQWKSLQPLKQACSGRKELGLHQMPPGREVQNPDRPPNTTLGGPELRRSR